jgi:CheY-like chemotaxis protein
MPLNIMVVDEEQSSLQLMRSLTDPLDHTVLTLQSTQEAARCAQQQQFDVVFVGMRTPEMAGLDLARQIRTSKQNRDAAIVMLSNADDISSLRKAFGEGADFVLAKPVSGSRLRPMLTAMDSPVWKGRRHTPRMPLVTDVNCRWQDRRFVLRSLNISETGMLLRPSLDVALNKEVFLDFKIPDVRASLDLRARIVRKEGSDRVAVGFLGLEPEDANAIQLYVNGHVAVPASSKP